MSFNKMDSIVPSPRLLNSLEKIKNGEDISNDELKLSLGEAFMAITEISVITVSLRHSLTIIINAHLKRDNAAVVSALNEAVENYFPHGHRSTTLH